MVRVYVLRVFVDERGDFGNPVGVVFDPGDLSRPQRQMITTFLGYSETVFVDDVADARVQLFTPRTELPFAAHPLVGTGWLLSRLAGCTRDTLRPVRVAEPVPTFVEDGRTWVRGAIADAPDWEHVHLPDATGIDRLAPPEPGGGWPKTQVWAWLDEPAGIIRARVFASAFGVAEDEACGSATMLLADGLARPITVRHGQGSLVHARPVEAGRAEVGGEVVLDGVRTIEPNHYRTH